MEPNERQCTVSIRRLLQSLPVLAFRAFFIAGITATTSMTGGSKHIGAEVRAGAAIRTHFFFERSRLPLRDRDLATRGKVQFDEASLLLTARENDGVDV